MKGALTKRAGPLPVWGWVAITGVGLGALLLWRKSKSKAVEEGSLPIPSGFTANPPEGGVGSGGGGPGEVKSSGEGAGSNQVAPGSESAVPRAPVAEVLATLSEIEAAGFHRSSATGSAAPATSTALKTAKGGTPGRGGALFKAGTYKGHAAHIYAKAVKGGVGPGKNVIVLAPSHGSSKTAHSKTPSHAPAHVKGSTTHHKAAPKKPPARHGAAAKPKKKRR